MATPERSAYLALGDGPDTAGDGEGVVEAPSPATLEGHRDGQEGGFGRGDAGGLETACQGVSELDAQVEGESAGAGILGLEDGGAEGAGPGAEADGVGPGEAGVAATGAG